MTVGELIEELKKYHSDDLVLVEGYEGGFSDISVAQERTVRLNQYKEEYYGPHELDSNSNQRAVIFFRAPNPNAE